MERHQMIPIKKTWRYEYKIVLDTLTLEEVKSLVILHPKFFFERYPVRRVNNIYFDTNDLSNYQDALSGCSRRSKMRLRWYGESESVIKGVLELKEKEGMLISKTTQAIDKDINLDDFTFEKIISKVKQNLTPRMELEFSYACNPILINSYYRYYYETIDGSCRITLDYNLKFYDQRFYSRPNFSFISSSLNKIILEIKSDKLKADVLEKITNNFPFRISQNSKYVSGITI